MPYSHISWIFGILLNMTFNQLENKIPRTSALLKQNRGNVVLPSRWSVMLYRFITDDIDRRFITEHVIAMEWDFHLFFIQGRNRERNSDCWKTVLYCFKLGEDYEYVWTKISAMIIECHDIHAEQLNLLVNGRM